ILHARFGQRAGDRLLALIPRHGDLRTPGVRQLALGPLDRDRALLGVKRDLDACGNGDWFLSDTGHGVNSELQVPNDRDVPCDVTSRWRRLPLRRAARGTCGR